MVKYKFIASLHNIKIKETLSKGIIFKDHLRISNSGQKITEYVDNEFRMAMGNIEYFSLIKKPYIYSISYRESSTIIHDDDEGMNLLDYFLLSSQTFPSLLWLIKDNSVNVENGFLELEDGDYRKYHSNYRRISFYNVKGKTEEVEFSREELNKTVNLFNNLFDPIDMKTAKEIAFTSTNAYKGNRLERVFYFLQDARSQSYLPNRISSFVTLLETLLSTTGSDVTHKLKERLAWFIGEDYEERKEIFDNLGIIYSIRSANVHGNTMPKKGNSLEKLENLTIMIENYTRRLIHKFIGDETIQDLYKEVGETSDKKIEKWLNDMVLGGLEKVEK